MKIKFLILLMFIGLYCFSQTNQVFSLSNYFFEEEYMKDIDSSELKSNVMFRIKQEQNLKNIFSDILTKYFRKQNDTMCELYNISKYKIFHIFDLGDILATSSSKQLKIYAVKMRNFSDKNNIFYFIINRFSNQILLFEPRNQISQKIEVAILFDEISLNKIFKEIYKNEIMDVEIYNSYTALVPFTKNELLCAVYYDEKKNIIKLISVDLKNQIMKW